MDKISLDHELVDTMVAAADRVFKDEWGDFDHYDLWDAKDCFRACMNVVSYIVSQFFSSDGIAYFDSVYDSELSHYFGGKKSE